ncbi:thiol reductant ABC exporter subunit CydD [Actinokineospora sp. UTMC 2448]|uniref:thiol reductant ABC exporter subunit CydD n=1 Tax=Actinokineospora sp. UTMC 2448 TaxID=2268449 RepID=UPI002164EB7A|nr:thiol reductant ABC exporter subunit CydD [Actinokineospora sp. UTMC 2448]UVS77105.1 ATP-binding/permease protein CydD [Actinokineospora sp. UTMC 2448]
MRTLPGGRGYLAVLGAFGAATAVAVLVQAELLASFLVEPTVSAAVVAGLAIAARAGIGWAREVVAARTAARVTHSLRTRVIDGVPGDAGSTVTLLTRGLDALRPYLTGYLPAVAVAAVVPLAVLVRLAFVDLTSALVVALTLPLVPVFAALVGKHTAARTQWAALARLGGHFLDVLRGLPTLRLFQRVRAQSETVRAMARAHTDLTMRTLRVAFLSALVLELVATLSVALVAVPVGLRLLSGGVAAHTAVLILVLTPEAYLPLRAAGARFHASTDGLAALNAALAVPRPPARGTARPPDPRVADIAFEGVTVSYPDRGAVLRSVDLRIEPGERIAVAGPSGAGKSTLLAVLLGLVTPSAGRVAVGGVDLRELDPAAWRAHLAWVPQRPWLFAGSVRANVALGGPDVDTALAAADLAGLDGPVGELSTGQAQRVALARALARPAGLVLLDEPTAHLDGTGERVLLTAWRALDQTSLVVAHRPVFLREASRVLIVRSGVVV